ncbi:phosphopantetheine-binding protein [Nocardia sp. NPDC003482]
MTAVGDEIRATLAEFWTELLEVDAVAGADRFLESGGNSLRATMLANRVEFAWGFRPSMEQLLGCTFDELVDLCVDPPPG